MPLGSSLCQLIARWVMYLGYSLDDTLSGLVTIGCPKNKSNAFCALLAAVDIKRNAMFHSTVVECMGCDVLVSNLWSVCGETFTTISQNSRKVATNCLLFYLDGIGDKVR